MPRLSQPKAYHPRKTESQTHFPSTNSQILSSFRLFIWFRPFLVFAALRFMMFSSFSSFFTFVESFRIFIYSIYTMYVCTAAVDGVWDLYEKYNAIIVEFPSSTTFTCGCICGKWKQLSSENHFNNANNVAWLCMYNIIGIIYLQANSFTFLCVCVCGMSRIWVISCKVQQSSVKCSDSNKMAHTAQNETV